MQRREAGTLSRRRFFIEQTPAPVVFLTAADTDIQTLAAAAKLPAGFPGLRVASLCSCSNS